MRLSLRKGFSFGLASGIITTLGLIVGLDSGTHSKSVVMGGIFVIAVADALSDAMGMHISEEAAGKTTHDVWASTLATLFSKFIFAMLFVIPVALLPLTVAITVSVLWGMLLIALFSYSMARDHGVNPLGVISEHIGIAIVVVILTHYIGNLISLLA